jgi:preprotein translocase subunit SecF
MNIVKRKNLFFTLSLIIIVPGLISLFLYGLKPAIDFTGGSIYEFKVQNVKLKVDGNKIKGEINKLVKIENIKEEGNSQFQIRTEALSQKQKVNVENALKKKFGKIEEISFETVGAVIGSETTWNALKAVVIASIAILLYIAFVFRKVSHPVASWKYGIVAIIALLHDVLLVVGIFSILGVLFRVEVDSLFITALLTVMGFSVHDTIVVFDRIRENLKKNSSLPFETTVNNSILETMNRSLNTSITVVMVLFMLLLFGGESIKWFVVALLIGIVSGTYSSIFTASPLLVVWYEFDKKRKHR